MTSNDGHRTAVAAVIVRWRGGEVAEHCLRSLEALPAGPEEVVLVDSGSGDGGVERIVRSFARIRVEELTENVGFAAAANHGVAVTTAPLVLLLNPDTELVGNGLSVLVTRLLDDPDLAGVVPLLENTDGSSQHRWQLRRLPTVLDLALGRSGRPAFSTQPTSARQVPQPAAAAWLVRRTVWRALQGFDEVYRPAWWEDVDFCKRLESRLDTDDFPTEHGFGVEPRARVRHRGGSSVEDLGSEAFRAAFYCNLLRYAELHHAQSIGLIRLGLRISNALRRLRAQREVPDT